MVKVNCQYCETDYCESRYCSGAYLNRCEGDGCERANCFEGECFDGNEEKRETVRQYTEGVRPREFCDDCYPGGMVLS